MSSKIIKSSLKAGLSTKKGINTNAQDKYKVDTAIPELTYLSQSNIDSYKTTHLIDLDEYDLDDEEKFKYNTEDEIAKKELARQQIDEIKKTFKQKIDETYDLYRDTNAEYMKEKITPIIQLYKDKISDTRKGIMFVLKMAKAPTENELVVIRQKQASESKANPLPKPPPYKTNFYGDEKKLIKKVRAPGTNITPEMEQLNEQISKLDQSYINAIEREEEDLNEKNEIKRIEINEKYRVKREEEEQIQMEREKKGEPNELEQKLKWFDVIEGTELNSNDQHTMISIIAMKYRYIKMSQRGIKVPNSNSANNSASNNSANSIVEPEPEPVILQDPKLFVNSLLHCKISVSFMKIGHNMDEYFKRYAETMIEGKCHKEGYVQPNSTTIINYSSGLLKSDMVIYDVIYSVNVCFPYENMELMCKIKNITKIGIRGIISEHNNPIVLFISREHNSTKNFDDYEEGQNIKVRVIGHRFELNDEFISVIGEII
jgi:hypothetical protein